MSTSTQIKRLKQSGKEFVPITLQEAVVVNTTNIPKLSSLGITTLDKVLRQTLNLVSTNETNVGAVQGALDQAILDINAALVKKQDKLTAGNGIVIETNQSGELVISTNLSFEIYKVVDKLPAASAACANTIFLVPTTGVSNSAENDILEEYLCVKQSDGTYAWERLGRITAGVDLSEYIERISALETDVTNIKTALADTITAVDVTTSKGNKVVVTYTIPEDLYDSVVGEDDDKITT